MPLTRGNVTAASRIMLPAHIIFSTWLGLAWLLQADIRTAVPALYALRNLWPIQATGVVMLAVGIAALAGVLSHQRPLAAVALGMGALTYLGLGAAIGWSSLHSGGSLSAPAWPLYVAVCHMASMVSLARDSANTEGNL